MSLCQNEVTNKNNTPQLHDTFCPRKGLPNQTCRKQIFMITTCTLKMQKSATEIKKNNKRNLCKVRHQGNEKLEIELKSLPLSHRHCPVHLVFESQLNGSQRTKS